MIRNLKENIEIINKMIDAIYEESIKEVKKKNTLTKKELAEAIIKAPEGQILEELLKITKMLEKIDFHDRNKLEVNEKIVKIVNYILKDNNKEQREAEDILNNVLNNDLFLDVIEILEDNFYSDELLNKILTNEPEPNEEEKEDK